MPHIRSRTSIQTKLSIFAEWWKGDNDWFTQSQWADIIDCNIGSMRPAFSALRRNGYIITKRWVWSQRCNLYNIRKGTINKLIRQAARPRSSIELLKAKLEHKIDRY